VQYLYDEAKSNLVLNDLKFASAQRGVAVGYIEEGKRVRPTALVTADGGAHWSLVPTREVGVTLYLLNENTGWMVTPKGLWQTTEAGRNWNKLPNAPKGVLRVHFLDEQHGFAVGMKKKVFETRDSGGHWTEVPAAAEPNSNPDYSSYTWITFATPMAGIISGWSFPPRHDEEELPDWIEPDKAIRRSEVPHLSLTLETKDGGKTWQSSTTSMFGRITRIRFGASGTGLGLVEFALAFAWPSEIYRLNYLTGKSERVYREKNRAITDVWLTNSGTGYLAGVEVLGQLRTAGVPGKLKMLRSADLTKWTEMDADYRAVANRATLAVVDDDNLWVATDTGIILRLEP
jgi:photosystem II stability/assembly factor-like uncharacterized protein